MALIAIVDYGMGNLHSVARAMRYASPDATVKICQNKEDIDAADRVVFPGQGAMPDCMRHLVESGLHEAVLKAAKSKPLLGICVGEQMLFGMSEEGNVRGLGVFEGAVKRFAGAAFEGAQRLKVPQIGWNQVRQSRSHELWTNIPDAAYFYFVHSFYVQPATDDLVVGETLYGDLFTSAVAHENIFATQFHPEKSAEYGLQLLSNFANWKP